jgi:hypothetical protein
VPEITAKFQSSRVYTAYPTEWHAEHGISYVTAHLIALKEPMERNGGTYLWESLTGCRPPPPHGYWRSVLRC